MADPQHEKRFKFDPTINLGHVLSLVAFLLAGIGAWSALDKRLTILEEGRKLQEIIDKQQDERVANGALRLEDLLRRLENQVGKLNDKLDNRTNLK